MSRERTKDLNYDELMRLRLTGLAVGGPAMAEMELQIRHLEALDKATKTNDTLSKRVYALNWIATFLTVISTALAFSLWLNPEWKGLLNFLGMHQ